MLAPHSNSFSNLDQLKQFAEASQTAARLGGEVLMKLIGRADVWKKGPADWVTAADFESQRVIKEFLITQFPDHQFLGEEAEQKVKAGPATDTSPVDASPADTPNGKNAEFCWIVDPLDGTTNYVHQLASFSVSIGLRHRDPKTGIEQILAGCVFDPMTNECYSATLGGGATRNGQPIGVSACTALDDALTVFSMGSQAQADNPQVKRLLNVLATASTVRRLGSAALNLCFVACGRVDAYWATNLSPWDVAAGWLIACEAGAVIEDFENQPLDLMRPKFCCASTRDLFNELQPLLHV